MIKACWVLAVSGPSACSLAPVTYTRGRWTHGNTKSLPPGRDSLRTVPKKREEQGSHGRSISPPQPECSSTRGAWSPGPTHLARPRHHATQQPWRHRGPTCPGKVADAPFTLAPSCTFVLGVERV